MVPYQPPKLQTREIHSYGSVSSSMRARASIDSGFALDLKVNAASDG
jgi:hypothetical protein